MSWIWCQTMEGLFDFWSIDHVTTMTKCPSHSSFCYYLTLAKVYIPLSKRQSGASEMSWIFNGWSDINKRENEKEHFVAVVSWSIDKKSNSPATVWHQIHDTLFILLTTLNFIALALKRHYGPLTRSDFYYRCFLADVTALLWFC